MVQLAFFGAIVVLIVAVIAITSYMAKKRREAWQAVAPKLELRYVGQVALASSYPGFKTFSIGRSRKAANLLEGESALPARLGRTRSRSASSAQSAESCSTTLSCSTSGTPPSSSASTRPPTTTPGVRTSGWPRTAQKADNR